MGDNLTEWVVEDPVGRLIRESWPAQAGDRGMKGLGVVAVRTRLDFGVWKIERRAGEKETRASREVVRWWWKWPAN